MKRKNIKLFITILLIFSVVLGITGCNKKVEENVEYEISKEDMLIEYDYVWELLENNYPYFDALKKRGVNTNSLRTVFRNFVEKAEDFDEYYYLMSQLLNYELKTEGHLYLLDPITFQRLNYIYESPENSPIKNKKVYQYIKKPFHDNKVTQRYSMLSEKYNLSTSYAFNDADSLEIIKLEEEKALIIDYNSFFVKDYEKNTEKIKQALEESIYDKIIIDIRGNYGGGLFVWTDFVELLLNKDINNEEFYLSKGKESTEIYNEGHYIKATLEKEFEKDLNVFKVLFTIESKKEINYNPDIYLLIDQGSNSASLKFAQFAYEYDFAKILSRQPKNGGDGGASYGYNLLTFQLPKSNLLLQFYTNIRCTKEGIPVDPVIEPDYIIDDKASYENVIRAIKSF